MRGISEPYKGGLNLDDELDRLPDNDYENGENLILERGVNYFKKLKGTTSIGNINGNCFGWFQFREYSFLFIDYPDHATEDYPHSIYRIDNNNNVKKVFSHEFDLDTSIFLSSCVLVNDKVLAFTNGAQEAMKVHLEQAELTVNLKNNAVSFAGYNIGTIGQTDGFIHIDFPAGFQAGTRCLYLYSIVDPTALSLIKEYSLLANNVARGELSSSTRFITQIEARADVLTFNGDSIGFLYCEFDVEVGYRKITPKDYYLINTPPLDPPVIEFISDPLQKVNKIKNNIFQFQSKYIYHDESQSSWSPLSTILLDDSVNFVDYNKNNGILISTTHPSKYERDNVKEVVFGVRINNGSLYEIDRKPTVVADYNLFSTDVNTPIQTTFYNDQVLLPVLEKEALNQFDLIGEKVGTLEVVDSSILNLANNKIPKAKVVPNGEISYNVKDALIPQSDDWFFAYRYVAEFPSGGGSLTADGTNYKSQGTQDLYPLGATVAPITRLIQSWTANNYNAKGESVDPLNAGTAQQIIDASETITKADYIATRREEYGDRKAFAYFDFSAAQVVGTVYNVTIQLYRTPPNTGRFQLIKNVSKDFVAATTDTTDLLNKIKDWVDNNAGLNFPYGEGSIETQMNIGNANFNQEFTGITARSADSIQIFSGYQDPGNDPGNYHWYQIDKLAVTIEKTSATSYLRKTFKNQAEHRLAYRYRDGFGRILANIKAGTINLSQESSLNKYYEGVVKINHQAPLNAKRCDILYAGNKSYKDFIYAVVTSNPTTPTSGVNQVEISLNFEPYNESYGASLAYSFTEGDVIQRLASNDGTSYTELDNKKTYRVIKDGATGVIVEYDLDNEFEAGDLVVIHTPKLEVEDDDTLYYESGVTLEVEDGLHLSPDGSQLRDSTLEATVRLPQGPKVTVVTGGGFPTPIIVVRYPDSITEAAIGQEIEILNTQHKGVYEVILNGEYPLDNEYEFVLVAKDTSLPEEDLPFEEDFIYFKWSGTTLTEYTGVYQKFARVVLRNFGDVYLRWRDSVYDHLIESYSISDIFTSREWGRGRPAIIDQNSNINEGGSIYYSEPYFNNTSLNGISTVFATSFKEYNNTYGDIKSLLEYGDQLIIFQERKISWVLIKKIETSTADGESIISIAPDVISSSQNFYGYEGGVGNQIYSIVKYEGGFFFVNPFRGHVCRRSASGIDVISDVKMSKYFEELFRDETLMVYSLYDVENRNLILHLKSDTINRQAIWSEEKGRWLPFWNIGCERMIFNKDLLSFNNEEAYVHGDEINRNRIYGSQLLSKFHKTFVFNQNNKAWNNIMMDPLFIDTIINVSNEQGQDSRLRVNHFEKIGRGYWSEFKQDLNTPNVSNPLLIGDDLQSKTLKIEVEDDTTENKRLGDIEIDFDEVE